MKRYIPVAPTRTQATASYRNWPLYYTYWQHQYLLVSSCIVITLYAFDFAFAASVPAMTVTYSVLMNLLTTLAFVVTTKPFSQHKYSVPQTFLVLTHLKTNLLLGLKPFLLLLHITLHQPNYPHMIQEHSHVLYSPERSRNVFKSYRRSNNLSAILVRAQLTETDNCNNARARHSRFFSVQQQELYHIPLHWPRSWQLYFLYRWNLQNQIPVSHCL